MCNNYSEPILESIIFFQRNFSVTPCIIYAYGCTWGETSVKKKRKWIEQMKTYDYGAKFSGIAMQEVHAKPLNSMQFYEACDIILYMHEFNMH